MSRSPRILILATADARGHLMRTQLLYHALRDAGAEVEVLTTSDDGAAFLAEFGVQAPVLSRHYAVVFDARQNMLPGATDRRIASYVLLPWHMLRDIVRLWPRLRRADLVLNDSFHPALLTLGSLPPWRSKIVHIFGTSLRQALEQNFAGRTQALLARTFARLIAWQIESAHAHIEHGFATPPNLAPEGRYHRLPTPVALPQANGGATCCDVAVYLNPHFSDERLAGALETAMAQGGWQAHMVGEGYAARPGWHARDAHWVDVAARTRAIIAAPGMAGLAVAHLFGTPIVLVLTDQPEQRRNAQRAAELGLAHRIVTWSEDPAAFAQALHSALAELTADTPVRTDGLAHARQRLSRWTDTILALARS